MIAQLEAQGRSLYPDGTIFLTKNQLKIFYCRFHPPTLSNRFADPMRRILARTEWKLRKGWEFKIDGIPQSANPYKMKFTLSL